MPRRKSWEAGWSFDHRLTDNDFNCDFYLADGRSSMKMPNIFACTCSEESLGCWISNDFCSCRHRICSLSVGTSKWATRGNFHLIIISHSHPTVICMYHYNCTLNQFIQSRAATFISYSIHFITGNMNLFLKSKFCHRFIPLWCWPI